FVGGLITGAWAFLLVAVQAPGDMRYIYAVTAYFAMIVGAFTVLVLISDRDPGATLGGVVPRLEDEGSLLLAGEILGATVMPHAIYLHSALVTETIPARTVPEKLPALRIASVEGTTAMGLAGLGNV